MSIRDRNISKIIESAIHVCGKNGIDATSVLMIAKHAKLPKSNVLYYFDDRAHLDAAVQKECFKTDLNFTGITDRIDALANATLSDYQKCAIALQIRILVNNSIREQLKGDL